MNNREAARMLFGVAALLESEGANRYRVRAYRRAAGSLLVLPAEAAVFLNTARELPLPWLGERLRRKLGELISEGRMQFYDDLIEALPSVKRELLAIPGVGPVTARRFEDELHLANASAVAEAARDGRLCQLRGIGKAREQQIGQAASDLLRKAA